MQMCPGGPAALPCCAEKLPGLYGFARTDIDILQMGIHRRCSIRKQKLHAAAIAGTLLCAEHGAALHRKDAGALGAGKVERVSADRMGMLATCMNCLAVCDVFRQLGAKARVMTAVDIQGVGERYDTRKAIEYMEDGNIVLFAGGSGAPFFSTDTAAVLRAAEIHADGILLAKNIDGVYDSDPRTNPDAKKFDRISYDEVLARHLAVMDTTATSLAMDNSIPVIVFALAQPENIRRSLSGEALGTTVG